MLEATNVNSFFYIFLEIFYVVCKYLRERDNTERNEDRETETERQKESQPSLCINKIKLLEF